MSDVERKPRPDLTSIKKEALRVLLDGGTTVYEKRIAGFTLDVLVVNDALIDALNICRRKGSHEINAIATKVLKDVGFLETR